MSKVTEGLISALRALPKEDKKEAIILLLDDEDFKVCMCNYLIEELTKNQQSVSHVEKTTITKQISRREAGKQEREKYITQLKGKGLNIESIDSIWGKILSGLLVAIPFASERRPNRWFLGVGEIDLLNRKAHNKVAIILLCRSKAGELIDFVIPPSKVEGLKPYLSRSKTGQFKFNLRRDGFRYHLLLTDEKPMDVTDYRSEISLLK